MKLKNNFENIKKKIPFLKNKSKKNYKVSDFDVDFVYDIQPTNNIIYAEDYVKKGNGYETCINIYDYPERVNDFWLKTISDMDIKNKIVTVDIGTLDNSIIEKIIEKNLKENEDRQEKEKNITDKFKSEKNFNKTLNLFDKIDNNNVTIKLINVRIFLYNSNLKNLETEVMKVLSILNSAGYKAGIFLNELEYDFKSIYHKYEHQAKEFLTKRNGKEINSETLGAGIDYDFSYLNDKNGLLYGFTKGGGTVVFNPFLKTESRKSYNGIILGKMGSGKSTFLKKFSLNNYITGSKIRIFDASGEFKKLVDSTGGEIINLNNPQNIVNPLQIYKSNRIYENETTEDLETKFNNTNELQNKFYQNHLSKFRQFFQYYSVNLDEFYLDELISIVDNFYGFKGFYKTENGIKIFDDLTNKKPNEYPILSDLLEYTEIIYKHTEDKFKKERIDKIILKLKGLVNTNGILFNGFSNIDIKNTDFLVFNIKELGGLENNVVSAVIFNILNILWDEMISNVDIEKMGSNVEKYNLKKYTLIIDEAHRIINDGVDTKTLKFFIDFEREARKYLGAIWLSYHTIDDVIKNEGLGKEINKLFNLSQYKLIFEQDIQLVEKLQRVFGDSITSTEIKKIPRFVMGECLLSLNTDNNIIYKNSLGLEDEESLIATGGV